MALKSVTTLRFRKCLTEIPAEIREQARKAYRIWVQDNNYPSLQFKQIHNERPIYSVRIGIGYRAIGIIEQDTIIWFWIGSHADYDNLLKKL